MTVIDARRAFGAFVESGKSGVFVELMDSLRRHGELPMPHATASPADPDDEDDEADPAAAWLAAHDPDRAASLHQWRAADLHQLERMLATRALGMRDARLQLIYFVGALAAVADQPEGRQLCSRSGQVAPWRSVQTCLEMLGPSREATFAGLFRRSTAAYRATDDRLVFADGFQLRFRRMPVVDAFLVFLLSSDLRGELMALLDGPAGAADASAQRRRAAANELARLLDPWLDEVVRGRDEIERFRQIIAILEAISDGEALLFDDASLLAFWQKVIREPQLASDFIKFDNAAVRFIDIAWSLRAAAAVVQLRRRGSIGTDREAGEFEAVSALTPEAMLVGEPDDEASLAALTDETSELLAEFRPGGRFAATKLLNKTECQRLELLIRLGRAIALFARTYLRAQVMGAVQGRMIQAKRDRDAERLSDLASLRPLEADAYDQVRAMLSDSQAHLARMLQAVFAVAMHWEPETFSDPRWRRGLAGPTDLDAARAAARQTFSRIGRKGMRDAFEDQPLGDLLIDAIDPLVGIATRLNAALQAIDGLQRRRSLSEMLADDRPPFSATFKLLAEMPEET